MIILDTNISTKIINFEDAKNKKENTTKNSPNTESDDSLFEKLREEMRKETGYYE